MPASNDTLTTGQVARICNVAPRTVSKWFDSGQLSGYRIPGSKDRRIPLSQLVQFMKVHGIPLNGLDGHQTRVVVIDDDMQMTRTVREFLEARGVFRVGVAASLFEGGVEVARLRPHVLLIDVGLPELDLDGLCTWLRAQPDLQGTRLVALERSPALVPATTLTRLGFEVTLTKPFDTNMLLHAVDHADAIVR